MSWIPRPNPSLSTSHSTRSLSLSLCLYIHAPHNPFPFPYPFPPPPPSISTYLVKVKHQIQLAHIPKERIQNLHEEVYRLQIAQLVIIGVHARAKEQACVSPVDDLGGAELDEVGLVLLVARRDQAVHFAFQADFLFVLLRGLGERKWGGTGPER